MSTSQSTRKRSQADASLMDFILLDHYEEIQAFQLRSHSLRIPASQVSALAGYHPYTYLPEVFLSLVYQGRLGNLLQYRDAQLLGMSLISKSDSLTEIASRGGEEIKKFLKLSEDIKSGKSLLKTVNEAKELKENLSKQTAHIKDLSKNEIQQLIDGFSHNIHTGFGHQHEDNALDEYEKMCGCTVRERNAQTMCWDFVQIDEVETSLATAIPMSDARVLNLSEPSKASHSSVVNIDPTQVTDLKKLGASMNDVIDLQSHDEVKLSSTRSLSSPYFSILGSIDGLRDEPYILPKSQQPRCDSIAKDTASNEIGEDEIWTLRTLVVECKHRMNRFYLPPPLYDQIQCIIYCLMFNTEAGEIVQVIRNRQEDKPTEEQMDSFSWIDWSAETNMKKVDKPFDIRVSKVYLDDPRNNHRQNFYNVILPRLRAFTNSVYSYRRDDSKRFTFLSAFASSTCSGNDDEVWNLLFQECPFLLDCDTSFHRKRKAIEKKAPNLNEE